MRVTSTIMPQYSHFMQILLLIDFFYQFFPSIWLSEQVFTPKIFTFKNINTNMVDNHGE